MHKYKALFELAFWPMLITLAVISLAGVARWLFGMDLNAISFSTLNIGYLLSGLTVQIIILSLAVLSWHCNLKLHGLSHIRLGQSLAMIGINAIGKYTPGKVWGLIARGAALLKLSNSKQVVFLATSVDQLALCHSGGAIAAITWAYRQNQLVLTIAFCIATVVSVFAVSRSARAFGWLKSRFERNKTQQDCFDESGFQESYVVVFLFSSLIWLLSALALYFCVEAVQANLVIPAAAIVLVTTLAYLSGFLAFFSLAGLGVREGVMVVMLGMHMDIPIAVYISIIHRLVTLVPDLLIGVLTAVSSRSALGSEAQH